MTISTPFKDPQSLLMKHFRVLVPGGRLYIGESALPEALRIVSNIPSYLTSGDDRRHSTYETLEYFKNAGLTKFRVYKKKTSTSYLCKETIRINSRT